MDVQRNLDGFASPLYFIISVKNQESELQTVRHFGFDLASGGIWTVYEVNRVVDS